jgi:hypothetical protein
MSELNKDIRNGLQEESFGDEAELGGRIGRSTQQVLLQPGKFCLLRMESSVDAQVAIEPN